MSSVEILLQADSEGWSNLPYQIKEKRPVREALASIEGKYTYVAEVGGQRRWYDVLLPNKSTLQNLETGHAYAIHLTQKVVTLRLKGPLGVSQAATSGALPAAQDATYYGTIAPSPDFRPLAGMDVLALIQGKVCGRGQTFERSGRVLYIIGVDADRPGAAGCGATGRLVTFQVGTRLLSTTARWESDRPRTLVLRP